MTVPLPTPTPTISSQVRLPQGGKGETSAHTAGFPIKRDGEDDDEETTATDAKVLFVPTAITTDDSTDTAVCDIPPTLLSSQKSPKEDVSTKSKRAPEADTAEPTNTGASPGIGTSSGSALGG